jgi:hypothetical protein
MADPRSWPRAARGARWPRRGAPARARCRRGGVPLYDTYGFPIDLTEDILAGEGLAVDRAGFDREMDAQRARARGAQRFVDARRRRRRSRPPPRDALRRRSHRGVGVGGAGAPGRRPRDTRPGQHGEHRRRRHGGDALLRRVRRAGRRPAAGSRASRAPQVEVTDTQKIGAGVDRAPRRVRQGGLSRRRSRAAPHRRPRAARPRA